MEFETLYGKRNGKKMREKTHKSERKDTTGDIYSMERDKKPLYVMQKMAENLTKNGTKFFRDG